MGSGINSNRRVVFTHISLYISVKASQSSAAALSLFSGVFCDFNINLPKRVEALEGSCVFIPCTFDIDQQYKDDLTDAKRIWYKDGSPPTVVFDSSHPDTGPLRGEIFGTPTEKNCTTRFNNVEQKDNGSYLFRIETNGRLKHSYRKPEDLVHISIIDSPPKPTVSLFEDQEETEVKEGSSVNLRCSTKIFCSSRPAVLTWSSSPEHLLKEIVTQQRQSETELISDLIFTVTHRHHSATFTCTVTHQLQKDITKSRNKSRTLQVQYAPKSTSAHVSPSGFVLEGRSVTLSCSSDANPPELNYTWYRDTEEHLKPVQTGQNLTINNTDPTHSGRYVCTAQNKHGAQNASVLLDVQYAPKNTSAHVSPSGFVLEGRSVTLSCSSDANPPELNYTWYRDTEEHLKPVQTGQNLTINNTDPTHSGRYVCTAQNKHSAQNASVLLDVQYAPKNTTLSLFPSGSVMEGRPVTLTCSTDAKPAVLKFSWYIETGSQFKLIQTRFNNTYVVSNPTNIARYRCAAQNQHGQHNTTIQLDPQFAPKISSSCNLSSVITCVCEAHGNPSPTLEWRLSGNVLANSTNTSISSETQGNTTLTSVLIIHQPLTETSVLQCFSRNTHGTASASTRTSQQIHLVTPTPKTETGFHHPSMLLGAAAGALAMMLLCIIRICYERRKNPKASGTRQDDRSGLILTQIATASDGDDECVYSVTHKPPESPHYSSIDFTNAEPASGEIRGVSSLTKEYAVVRHRSAKDAASATDPKKDQSSTDSGAKITDVTSEDSIYENMTRRLVV
ncbi:myelin-associated glycoprotein-like [Chanodichthys erythropterus]|uniref:myelin-associated glycoprotein-like n=1 Tax=Chanodichthys erythropterus TaxID=933992 RepID=UPI00351F19DC